MGGWGRGARHERRAPSRSSSRNSPSHRKLTLPPRGSRSQPRGGFASDPIAAIECRRTFSRNAAKSNTVDLLGARCTRPPATRRSRMLFEMMPRFVRGANNDFRSLAGQRIRLRKVVDRSAIETNSKAVVFTRRSCQSRLRETPPRQLSDRADRFVLTVFQSAFATACRPARL